MKSKDMIPDQVKELLAREALDDKEALEKVWLLASDPASKLGASDIDEAAQQFEEALLRGSTPKQQATLHVLRKTWKIAASFLIVALASYYYLMGEVVHEVPIGTTAALSLPDGSSVVLNSGSTLVHGRKLWGKERKVHLSGEAYFDVTSNERPFTVYTENAHIQVLGTAFNVDAWPADSARTMLRVTEGRVAISSEQDRSLSEIVTAGQESELVGMNNPPSVPKGFNADLARLWLQGGMVSIDQPIIVLAERLERRFDVHIVVDEALLGQRLTWIQPNLSNAQEALTDICELAGCNMEAVAEGFLLSPELE